MTLIEMLERNSKLLPEKTAIVFHDNKMTYKELNNATNKIAHALIEMGIKKGDRVGLMLPRIPELVISFIGIAKAHGISVPINFELLEDNIKAILTNISPSCLIVHERFWDLAKKSLQNDPEIPVIVVGKGYFDNCIFLDNLLKGKSPDNPSLNINDNDVVYFNYTSGSTGNSKGAVTTHSNIYWNTLSSVDALKMNTNDVHLCMFAPFAHPHEIFSRPLYLGGTMVLLENIYPKSLAKVITDNSVTCMMGLSPMYENLLEVLKTKNYDISSLRIPESGGMFTRTDLIERFKQKTGVPIIPVWGSTETTGIAIANRPDEYISPGSVGKPCMSYEVKIIDTYGKEVPDTQMGELIFKGPAVTSSYYNDASNSQMFFCDKWYYSGDLGRKDEEGNFYFIGRRSDMMKVAGLKVYPLEIEQVLLDHPDIEEAAVIAVKDRLRGEIPKAIIVTKNGINEKDVLRFCKEQLPHYKLPKIVEIRDSLPKIGSGKINKKQLQLEEK